MSVSPVGAYGGGVILNPSPGNFEELVVSAKIAEELLRSMPPAPSSKEVSAEEDNEIEDAVKLNRAIEMSRRWPGTNTQEGPVYSNINASTSRDPVESHSGRSVGTIVNLLA